jgi:hypothetical protein
MRAYCGRGRLTGCVSETISFASNVVRLVLPMRWRVPDDVNWTKELAAEKSQSPGCSLTELTQVPGMSSASLRADAEVSTHGSIEVREGCVRQGR